MTWPPSHVQGYLFALNYITKNCTAQMKLRRAGGGPQIVRRETFSAVTWKFVRLARYNGSAMRSSSLTSLPFDSLTLRAVVAELRAVLPGGQIQEVRQPTPSEVLLGIRSRGRSLRLLLSIDARFARVHLTAQRRTNPPIPPTFCMALRRHVENGTIQEIRQRDFDRILEIHIESHLEGTVVTARLVAELMGKHSNLILLAADGTIVDAAKRITRRINRVREVLPGLPYLPPPEPVGKRDPFGAPLPLLWSQETPHWFIDRTKKKETESAMPPEPGGIDLAEWLMAHYAGISPFLARELAARAAASAAEGRLEVGLQRAWEEIFGMAAQDRYAPVLVREENGRLLGAYPLPLVQFPAEAQERVPDLNSALDAAFAKIVERAEVEAAIGQLRGRIKREIARWERQRQSAERTLEEADRAEAHKQAGDLLLANLWRVQPGDSRLAVQDFYDPALPERVLALDPKLTAQENAEAYFRRYRKARDGAARAEERREEAVAALEALRRAETRLDAVDTEEAVQALQDELTEGRLLRAPEGTEESEPSSGPDFQGHKIRRYQTPEGYEIYVGETATANDYLTTRIAAPNDLWLHVRAAASAHVVIRTRGKPEAVPRSVLERAATLCAQHSSQKHSSLVPVDYTLKKYVRKPRGAAPGSVLLQREKTLHVTPT